ncbi:ABC transporter substrate-binding protein [Beijerinckia sp. L45]|uniref:ABC transporter substrate-binding protein n=1 Tax=Beijerinckia sp. L45 TaxID=1641855 RepID=UPI00131D742A|nr:ABC transporter substrate-binding protein [Beijerinckia sp. L45]
MQRDHEFRPSHVSRRSLLLTSGAAMTATAATVISASAFPFASPAGFDRAPRCGSILRTAAGDGPVTKLKLAWNATAICTASAPVAKERGFFARHNLDVEFVNFGGSTDQLLEAIATGKADAGIGMALRWLKPLEQGFDVKITAGVHGGCLRLIGAKAAGVTTLESLKGKTIAVSDQASPEKNFFSIMLKQHGIDPETDVTWRQYPAELLPLAVDKGEAQAIANSDPRAYIWLKDQKFVEIATNLTGAYATRACCVLAVRGSLIREQPLVARALTQAVLEAGEHLGDDPTDAAKVFAGYGGKGSVEDLAQMLRSHTHHHHPVGHDLQAEIAAYTDELKLVNVIKKSTDSQKFAARVYADVLS